MNNNEQNYDMGCFHEATLHILFVFSLSASDCIVSDNSQQQAPSNKGDPLLQEDLEELDPGWQLQEGFVWDPHTGNTPRKMPPQLQQQVR